MHKVIVYSSDSCGYCQKTKKFLKDNGVQFVEKKVDFDQEAQKEMMKMGAKGVPVIKVDDEIIMGFDQSRLEALFGKLIIECPSCRAKIRLPRNKGVLQATCPKCSTKFKVNSDR